MILQSDLNGEVLANTINDLVSSRQKLLEMGKSARTLSRKDAASATADIIEELAGK
jgi:UDP-N-acetylglucosamine:LPS N-acetylglucosamine transferase